MLKQVAEFSLVLLACAASALAQKPSEAPPAEASPILLYVQVTDKAGQPIPGLQQSDFTLLDDGKAAPIQLFRELSGSKPNNASIMLLIDTVTPDFNEVTYARQQIAKFLRSYGQHLPAPVSVSVLTDASITQLLPPLTDGTRLAAELEQSQAHLRPVPQSADWGAEERWQESMEALERITIDRARRPGRTILIWISPGWSIFNPAGIMITDPEQAWFMKMIVGISTGLRVGRVTLDSVDPIGPQDGANQRAIVWQGYLKPVKKQSDAYPSNLSLQVLATQSGGRVLYASNDVAHELAQCAEDASDFYAIQFAGRSSDQPDTWHDLEVKVDRPGVVVRTNQGYYAQPPR